MVLGKEGASITEMPKRIAKFGRQFVLPLSESGRESVRSHELWLIFPSAFFLSCTPFSMGSFPSCETRDIWNALYDFLRAVSLTVPKALWSWMEKFWEASYRVALFSPWMIGKT